MRVGPSFDYDGAEGVPYFLGHTATYLRSPRADVPIDVVVRAVHGYRASARTRFKEAVHYVLKAPRQDVRRLAAQASAVPSTGGRWGLGRDGTPE